MAGLKVITPPAVEPVTLAETKTFLRVDTTDDDDTISAMITAAREYCEQFQNRAYITQTWDAVLDEFPDLPLKLPKPPLLSVDSITYTDYTGADTVWDAANYVVDTDSEPGRVAFAYGASWPSVTLQSLGGVRIRFTAGYGTADEVPKTVKQAMMMLVAHWYDHREAVMIGSISKEIEFAVHALLWQNRVVPV